jgi:hypothetical protein
MYGMKAVVSNSQLIRCETPVPSVASTQTFGKHKKMVHGTMLYTKHKLLQDEIYMEWNWYN